MLSCCGFFIFKIKYKTSSFAQLLSTSQKGHLSEVTICKNLPSTPSVQWVSHIYHFLSQLPFPYTGFNLRTRKKDREKEWKLQFSKLPSFPPFLGIWGSIIWWTMIPWTQIVCNAKSEILQKSSMLGSPITKIDSKFSLRPNLEHIRETLG